MENQGGGVYTFMIIVAFLALCAAATLSYMEYDEYLKFPIDSEMFKD